MIRIGEIKDRARASLENSLFGNVWLRLVVCAVVTGLLTSLPSLLGSLFSRISPSVGALIGGPLAIVSVLIAGPFEFALARIYQRVAQGQKELNIQSIFDGFKENFVDAVILGFMRNLYIFLWTLLFIIPGIVKAYAYSMSFFIQQEAGGKKGWRQCIDESIALTDGYKGKLFLLDLSFIGWYILGFLCLGIGTLWVAVYHQAARAHFYEELKLIKYGAPEEPAMADAEDDAVFTGLTDEEHDEDVYRYDDKDDE